MTLLSRVIVWGTALFFIVYGLGFVFYPAQLADVITGSAPASASALIDMRATYGGLTVAVGVVFLLLGAREHTVSLSLRAIAVVLLAMAAGRGLGMLLDGAGNVFMWLYLAGEVLFGALALWLSGREG